MAAALADENSWTTFEKLLLIQSVYKYGDNWLAISRTMKGHTMVSHAPEFFTQKNCITKYNTLVDPLKNEAEIEDEHKKRSGEYVNDKQRMPWTAKLARQLYHERIIELKSFITSTEQTFRTLVNEIDEIKSGKWDNKFAEMIKDEQRNKELEKKSEEASITSTAEVPKESTDVISDENVKIESSVVQPSAEVESVIPMDVEKNVAATIEEETVVSIEPHIESKPLIEMDPLSTTEDMEIEVIPSLTLPSVEVNKDVLDELQLQPQSPATPLAEPNESSIIDSSKGQNVQVEITVPVNVEVQKDNIELPIEDDINLMDIDDEKPTVKPISASSSISVPESTLETDVSKAEQNKKPVVSPNTESVIAEDTPQTIGGDIAMDLDELSVEILIPGVAGESPERVHFAGNLVTSPTSIEEVDTIENIIPKEQYESKGQPSKITAKEEIDSKEPEISDITSKQSTSEEATLEIIKSAELLSPTKSVAETKLDKIEDISEEVEDGEKDIRMIDSSTLQEENEDSSKEKATSIPQAEFKEPLTPVAGLVSNTVAATTPSNAPPSTPGDHVAPTPTPQYDTAPTPSGETPDDKKLKTWQKLVSMILHEISNHRFASVFQNPIREQDAPGYYDIVKQPMDLRTLKKRLREGTIHDTNLFHRDLMLMFMNASVFNREETDIHQMALEMKDHVETQISEFRRSEGSGGTHEPATRRKSMAIDAHEAAYFTSDRRSEGDRSVVTGSSLRGKFKDDTTDQRPTKKTKRLSVSIKRSERDI